MIFFESDTGSVYNDGDEAALWRKSAVEVIYLLLSLVIYTMIYVEQILFYLFSCTEKIHSQDRPSRGDLYKEEAKNDKISKGNQFFSTGSVCVCDS